jgi:hypothetical protein
MGSTLGRGAPSLQMMHSTMCAMTFAFCRPTKLVGMSTALLLLPMVSRRGAGTIAISFDKGPVDQCKLPLAGKE